MLSKTKKAEEVRTYFIEIKKLMDKYKNYIIRTGIYKPYILFYMILKVIIHNNFLFKNNNILLNNELQFINKMLLK